MLVGGTAVTLVFIICAVFAGQIAPYGHAQQDLNGQDFPRQGEPSDTNQLGYDRARHGRALAHDLGRAHRARGRRAGAGLLDRHRRAARADLGLRRRLARPHPGPDQRRPVRVPVPAAGDRRRVPAREPDRQRHRGHRDRDHRRLRAAVLPGGESVDLVGPRSHLHRGGACHGGQTQHDHPPLPVRQRRPERAGDRDAQRRRRDPDARRPRLPRARHRAQRGGRVGLRPAARGRRRGRRHLVDGALPRPRDRARGDRADARRRGPQRRAQPDAAAAQDRQADGPPARDRVLVHRSRPRRPTAEQDAGY